MADVFITLLSQSKQCNKHADNSVPAIFDLSEHIKLTHVSSAIALFLCLFDICIVTSVPFSFQLMKVTSIY